MLRRIIKKVKIIKQFIETHSSTERDILSINITNAHEAKASPLPMEKVSPNFDLLNKIITILKSCYVIDSNKHVFPKYSAIELEEKLYYVRSIIKDEIFAIIDQIPKPPTSAYLILLANLYDGLEPLNKFQHNLEKDIQIILPIWQSVDPQSEGGKCFGYWNAWTEDILRYNQYLKQKRSSSRTQNSDAKESKNVPIPNINSARKVLGVPYSEIDKQNIRPLSYFSTDNSTTIMQLNHFAPITPKVSILQEERTTFNAEVNLESMNALATEMIARSNKHPGDVCRVTLMGHWSMTGHTFGLIKTEDNYFHFCDANGGWIRCRSEGAFKRWFQIHYLSLYGTSYQTIDYLRVTLSNDIDTHDSSKYRKCYTTHELNKKAMLMDLKTYEFHQVIDATKMEEAEQRLASIQSQNEQSRVQKKTSAKIANFCGNLALKLCIQLPCCLLVGPLYLAYWLVAKLPCDIWHYKNLNHTLDVEKNQAFADWSFRRRQKSSQAQTSSTTRCYFYFNDDNWIGTHNARSVNSLTANSVSLTAPSFTDDMALLPRFFSPKAPLEQNRVQIVIEDLKEPSLLTHK